MEGVANFLVRRAFGRRWEDLSPARRVIHVVLAVLLAGLVLGSYATMARQLGWLVAIVSAAAPLVVWMLVMFLLFGAATPPLAGSARWGYAVLWSVLAMLEAVAAVLVSLKALPGHAALVPFFARGLFIATILVVAIAIIRTAARRSTTGLARLGVWLVAVAAGVVAAIGGIAAPVLLAGFLDAEDARRPEATIAPATRGYAAVGAMDEELARAYEPALQLASGEQWKPSAVDGYLQHAKLKVGRVLQAGGLLDAMSRRRGECEASDGHKLCVVTIQCPRARSRCALDPALQPKRAVYAVVNREPWREFPKPVSAAAAAQGPLRGLTTLITYWLFYPYDDWRSGDIEQWHEADWEAVAVGLDAKNAPKFVALSQHCHGTVLAWSDARLGALGEQRDAAGASAANRAGLHPVVYVARGSHANYPNYDRKSPDWMACEPWVKGQRMALTFAALSRGWTAFEQFDDAYPSEHALLPPIILASPARTRLLWYPARWSSFDTTRFTVVRLPPNDGPRSPGDAALTVAPIETMFCRWTSNYCPQGGEQQIG
jgi:hypothetical protein